MNERLGRVLYTIGLPLFRLYLAFRRSARVIVEHDGTYLVVKPWIGSGVWLLPGGGIRRHESSAHAAVRELREETGITVALDTLTRLGQFRCQHGRHLFSHDTVFWCCLAQPSETHLHSIENIAAAWQTADVMRTACGNSQLVAALAQQRSKAGLL